MVLSEVVTICKFHMGDISDFDHAERRKLAKGIKVTDGREKGGKSNKSCGSNTKY
jgi:hypothetical protein